LFKIEQNSILGPLQTVRMKDKSLSAPCPTCSSGVGQRCVLNTDQPRTTSHYARRVIAKDYAQSAKAARSRADEAKDSYARDSHDLAQIQRVAEDASKSLKQGKEQQRKRQTERT
jgi:hypothetical protein